MLHILSSDLELERGLAAMAAHLSPCRRCSRAADGGLPSGWRSLEHLIDRGCHCRMIPTSGDCEISLRDGHSPRSLLLQGTIYGEDEKAATNAWEKLRN